jgi:hypothetical protein
VCDGAGHDEDCEVCTVAGASDGDADSDTFVSRACANTWSGATPTCDTTRVRLDASALRVVGLDCDDTDANVRPSQTESCNGRDDNCNGMIDEGAMRRFYPDRDGDGAGDAASPGVQGCIPPSDMVYVENNQDCDDHNGARSPSATEVCNGTDDNCDGTVDEALAADASCSLAGATGVCTGGACAIASCAGTLADCDGIASNGCEADLSNSADHCGTCATSCGAGGVCTAASCDHVVQVRAGGAHTCALRSSGRIACWGANNFGQLGDGTMSGRSSAVEVRDVSNAVSIALGDRHTCALLADGTVSCWGLNFYGAVGDGSFTDRNVPTPVAGLADATALYTSASANHTCVLTTGGEVLCWGANESGQCDPTSTMPTLTRPTIYRGSPSGYAIRDITVGGSKTCVAVVGTETVGGMRVNVAGAGCNPPGTSASCNFVYGSFTYPFRPMWPSTVVITMCTASLMPIGASLQVGVSSGYGCVSGSETSTTRCWTPSGGISSVPTAVELEPGTAHLCWTTSTDAFCEGANSSGQLGRGTTTASETAGPLPGSSGAISVAAGGAHTCWIDASFVTRCVGANDRGQLGTAASPMSSAPVVVTGL